MGSEVEWIVFSDLHVKLSNWPLCKEILEHVHKEAVRLGANVLFAGDFFDISGDFFWEYLANIMLVKN